MSTSLVTVALAAAATLTGCTVEHGVELEIDTSAPISCVDDEGDPLVARVFRPPHNAQDVLYVFDFVRTPTVPRCRPTTIVDECLVAGCEAIPSARVCLRIPRERIPQLSAEVLDTFVLSDLVEGSPLLASDAPERTVAVRLTVVLDGSAEPPCPPEGGTLDRLPRFDEERLVGCGYSCPVVLEEESVIEIDLDPVVAGAVCGPRYVEQCALVGIAAP